MKTKTNLLHAARLNNNCPECYGTEGLEFEFSQTEKENLFFKKFSSKIESKLYCHTCKVEIYPIRWTEDIERVYEYNLKLAQANIESSKTKIWFWILMLLVLIIVVGGIYFGIS